MALLPDVPRQRLVPTLYQMLMRLSRRHGLGKLSRFNHWMYPDGQVVHLPSGGELFIPPDPHFMGYIVEHERHIMQLITGLVQPGDV